MSVAEHAENILTAWATEDYRRFDAEVESALLCCETAKHRTRLDFEQHELLRSIAEHLEQLRPKARSSESKLDAGLALLRHLAGHRHRKARFTIVRHQKCDTNFRGQVKAVRRGQ